MQLEVVLRWSCCFRRRGELVELLYGEDGAFGLAASLWGCLLASRVELKWTSELCLRGEGSPSGWGCLFGGHCVSGALYREHWRVLRQWWRQSLRYGCWGACRGG